MTQQTALIYIAPGERQCRVYCVPEPLPAGASGPRDVPVEQRQDWSLVATLGRHLEIQTLKADYRHLKDDISGATPGSHLRVDAQTLAIID